MRVALTAACLAAAAIPAAVVDSGAAVIPAAQVPAIAGTAAGFAPAGWRVERRVVGDLDRDSQPDRAIVLVESGPLIDAYGRGIERARALIIALRNPDGTLRRAAIAPRLLGCTTCGGVLFRVMRVSVVHAGGGVLAVDQWFGSRELTQTTHHIRRDPVTGRFVLVRLVTLVTDRLTGRSVRIGTNLLTRRQVTTVRSASGSVTNRIRTVDVRPRRVAGLVFGVLRP